MASESPKVSIILPVRNAGPFLSAAFDSLFCQTFEAFELIAIDNGSSDESARLLENYASSDRRVRLLHHAPPGIVGALALGLAHARAPLIARMDADDIAHPDRLAHQVAALDRQPQIAALGSAACLIDENGHELGFIRPPAAHEEIVTTLNDRNCMIHPTVMFRLAAVEAVGGYRQAYLGCEDYDLWLRLSERFRIGNLANVLLSYRVHGGQATNALLERRILAEIAALVGAQRRKAGGEDLGNPPLGFDAALLESRGVEPGRLAKMLALRAVAAARGAIGIGQLDVAREALDLADRSSGVGVLASIARLRARFRWITRSGQPSVRRSGRR